MIDTVLPWIVGVLSLSLLLCLLRLWRGPDLVDRVLALDTLYVHAMALLVLIGIWFRTSVYIEAALTIAAMGFIGTLALAKYLLRRDLIE